MTTMLRRGHRAAAAAGGLAGDGRTGHRVPARRAVSEVPHAAGVARHGCGGRGEGRPTARSAGSKLPVPEPPLFHRPHAHDILDRGVGLPAGRSRTRRGLSSERSRGFVNGRRYGRHAGRGDREPPGDRAAGRRTPTIQAVFLPHVRTRGRGGHTSAAPGMSQDHGWKARARSGFSNAACDR